MSIKDFLRAELKEKPLQSNTIYGAGQELNSDRNYDAIAKEGFEQNPLVNAIVTKYGEIFAGLPIVLEQVGRRGEVVKIIEQHPVLDLLNRPNDYQGKFSFLKEAFMYFFIAGSGFIKKGRPSDNAKPVQLWNIVPNAIFPVSANLYGEIAGFKYNVNQERVRKEDVIYIKSFNALKAEDGFSAIKSAGILIDTYNAMMRWNYSLSQNAGIPPMVVKSKSGKFTEEQKSRIEETLSRKVNGWNNAGKPLLQDGEAEFQVLGIKPTEAQWLESMQDIWRQICVALGSSPELWGSEKGATFSNRAEAMKDLYLNTILPKAQVFYDALNYQLLPDFERTGLRLVVDKAQIDALSESQDSLYKRVVDVFDKGIIGQGEARTELGFPVDVPSGDMVYLPSNKVPLSEE
jgi:HK97 family phage portal protein